MHPAAKETLLSFAGSSLAGDAAICPFEILSAEAASSHALSEGSLLLEHPPIPFSNFAWEWAPRMLHAAARLTLRLAGQALEQGFELKDATPHNIMFDAARPVFLDILSFVRPASAEAVWRPYAQFVRSFLYPLLACRNAGARLDEIFTIDREGLDTERMWRLSPAWRLCLPPLLGLVTIPTLAAGSRLTESYAARPARDREEAVYVQQRILRALARTLDRAAPTRDSADQYMDAECPYDPPAFAAKTSFVRRALQHHACKRILDLGCNTGAFSLLAAETGAAVVAIDHDPDVIGRLWERASAAKASILPLVVNLARPSPALGWDNGEQPSFLERARDAAFDGLLMLGLIHHLTVTERIPLSRTIDLAASLTTDLAVIEFVSAADPQFIQLSRGREALHRDWTPTAFEAVAARRFDLVARDPVSATRTIYALRKRRA